MRIKNCLLSVLLLALTSLAYSAPSPYYTLAPALLPEKAEWSKNHPRIIFTPEEKERVLKRIKTSWPTTEVIMLTGHASIDAAVEGMGCGAFDYLMKPADLEDLLYKLEDAFRKKSLHERRIQQLKQEGEAK